MNAPSSLTSWPPHPPFWAEDGYTLNNDRYTSRMVCTLASIDVAMPHMQIIRRDAAVSPHLAYHSLSHVLHPSCRHLTLGITSLSNTWSMCGGNRSRKVASGMGVICMSARKQYVQVRTRNIVENWKSSPQFCISRGSTVNHAEL